jgi:small nuclear ribonucleoprotein
MPMKMLEENLNKQVALLLKDNRVLEGRLTGYDEYMNMVLDDAVEIGKTRKEVGRILLKGDSITLLQEAQPQRKEPVAAAS